MMKLTFLGTGSAINTEDIGASILINENILIDSPCGIAQALRKFKIDINKLDTVIITHLHGDHVFGLPFLLLEYIREPRQAPLNILGLSGTKKLLSRLMKLAFPKSSAKKMLAPAKPFYIKAVDQKEMNIKGIVVRLHRVSHGKMETYGIEIREPDNKKIFYAPDTSFNDELLEIIKTVDAAILDATTPDKPIAGHMSMRQVNNLAKRFSGKRFMLTHRSSYDIDSLSYPLSGNVQAPVAGDTFMF